LKSLKLEPLDGGKQNGQAESAAINEQRLQEGGFNFEILTELKIFLVMAKRAGAMVFVKLTVQLWSTSERVEIRHKRGHSSYIFNNDKICL
jgi:hypothetical protein